jgi:hypothetical protein
MIELSIHWMDGADVWKSLHTDEGDQGLNAEC